ncbi:MAG: ABC transporter ATP-binding protein [Desulfobacterales bacterium]|jgi:multiple sugar transport system ATP-binding protein
MAFVELKDLTKHFGQVKAVDGVNLEISAGEFLVLLGPSGSGKTTLMRLCAGLEQPTAGHLIINGQVVNDIPPREREIAMVFQSYALYPHKTVFKNIAFPLTVEKLAKKEIKKKVEWSADLLGIGHLLDRRPAQISGGEKQRVAIARALVRTPKVLLLDEPLSNLDAQVRHTARVELKKFQQEIGVTTIYVTHDQAEAMGLGDRIAVMKSGKIRQIGTPDDIYHHPVDIFVAGFIGIPPMNFVEQNGVIVGFRPEVFHPADPAHAENRISFRFRILRVENLGSNKLAYGTIGDANVIANLSVRMSIEEGKEYDFSVRKADVRYYDKEKGARIDSVRS